MSGYGLKIGDKGLAECQSCGRVYQHVYGSASHTCEHCGGHVQCGLAICESRETDEQQEDE